MKILFIFKINNNHNNLVKKLGLNEQELLIEIAVALFKEEKITLGQAGELANIHQAQFQKILAKRKVPIHYYIDSLQNDLDMLKELGSAKN